MKSLADLLMLYPPAASSVHKSNTFDLQLAFL